MIALSIDAELQGKQAKKETKRIPMLLMELDINDKIDLHKYCKSIFYFWGDPIENINL